MNVFYEEEGTFKVGSILADNTTSLQVEAPHGKRAKIKAASVLLRFDAPSLSEFMDVAQKTAEDLDPNFLWECCESEAEFASDTLAADYFGHAATPEEAAAVLIRLHSAPMYFYKKGRGRYKAAPSKALEAALASQEKKRLQAEQQARYMRVAGDIYAAGRIQAVAVQFALPARQEYNRVEGARSRLHRRPS